MTLELINPDWPAPDKVRAVSTTRLGGASETPFDTLNLGFHPDDSRAAVDVNRRRLAERLRLPAEPSWLRQVHGTTAVDAATVRGTVAADASYALAPGVVCAVMTADCLPVLLCDRQGTRVAAVHAGWRGLAGGVVDAAVRALRAAPESDSLLAWLGPAIGPQVYEVGSEVRDAFIAQDRRQQGCFTPSPAGRWLADLYALARYQLQQLGVEVHGGGFCTYSDRRRFFSYRRDGSSGRMASLIWLAR